MTAAQPARRPRTVMIAALSVGVVVLLLALILVTRKNAEERSTDSPVLGKSAPALNGKPIQGEAFDIGATDRWLLVNFFATWCVPCQQEHDDLVRFSKFHAAAGDASVVSVVFSDQPADVKRFFAQRGGNWPVLRDDDGTIATAFGVARVPESYLVAPSGLVVGKVTGGVNFDFLQQELAKFENGTGG